MGATAFGLFCALLSPQGLERNLDQVGHSASIQLPAKENEQWVVSRLSGSQMLATKVSPSFPPPFFLPTQLLFSPHPPQGQA